jgi:Swt1-like HEPN
MRPAETEVSLVDVEPTEAINNLEVVLRDLIANQLADEFGADWVAKCGTAEKIQKWQDRQEEEAKKRDGTVVEERLIDFADFTDLLPIIKKHWPLFKPCLDDQQTFATYMGRLEDFRNAPMHSRPLVDFEQKLIEGMAGEIRNKVTLFRTEANAADRHFPRIEFVRDSFGTVANANEGIVSTDITVYPGDEVTFECSGWDPEDHPLKWIFGVVGLPGSAEYEGATCRIPWCVTEENIGEGTFVEIKLMGDRTWHRGAGHDGNVILRYQVLPR